MNEGLGFEVLVKKPYDAVVEQVIAALKHQGFGVLTRIDVAATFKEKLDEDFRPYMILGACNPPLSYRALCTDPVVGLMLPCNVTVEAAADNHTLVRIANPEMMLLVGAMAENEELKQVAQAARRRLEQVAEALLEV